MEGRITKPQFKSSIQGNAPLLVDFIANNPEEFLKILAQVKTAYAPYITNYFRPRVPEIEFLENQLKKLILLVDGNEKKIAMSAYLKNIADFLSKGSWKDGSANTDLITALLRAWNLKVKLFDADDSLSLLETQHQGEWVRDELRNRASIILYEISRQKEMSTVKTFRAITKVDKQKVEEFINANLKQKEDEKKSAPLPGDIDQSRVKRLEFLLVPKVDKFYTPPPKQPLEMQKYVYVKEMLERRVGTIQKSYSAPEIHPIDMGQYDELKKTIACNVLEKLPGIERERKADQKKNAERFKEQGYQARINQYGLGRNVKPNYFGSDQLEEFAERPLPSIPLSLSEDDIPPPPEFAVTDENYEDSFAPELPDRDDEDTCEEPVVVKTQSLLRTSSANPTLFGELSRSLPIASEELTSVVNLTISLKA